MLLLALGLLSGLLGGLGSLLVLIGAFSRSFEFLVFGGVFVILAESFDLVLFWHETSSKKQEFKKEFLKHVGSRLALPLLLLVLLALAPARDSTLAVTIGILALFKSVSLIIKATTSD